MTLPACYVFGHVTRETADHPFSGRPVKYIMLTHLTLIGQFLSKLEKDREIYVYVSNLCSLTPSFWYLLPLPLKKIFFGRKLWRNQAFDQVSLHFVGSKLQRFETLEFIPRHNGIVSLLSRLKFLIPTTWIFVFQNLPLSNFLESFWFIYLFIPIFPLSYEKHIYFTPPH